MNKINKSYYIANSQNQYYQNYYMAVFYYYLLILKQKIYYFLKDIKIKKILLKVINICNLYIDSYFYF